MHELSIARSLARLVAERTPPGATAQRVSVRIGPLRAVEPEAMIWAWTAETRGTPLDGVALDLELTALTMACDRCARTWQTDNPAEPCTCGNRFPRLVAGTDEITLVSLEVENAPT